MKISRYLLMAYSSPSDLSIAVNRAIEEGAIPYGHPYHTGHSHAQAVVYPVPQSSTIDRERII